MNLDSNSWNLRYLQDNTGWDVGEITTPLKDYFDQLGNKDIRILIPGCGNSYEAEYLFNNGFRNVYVLDFSRKALDNFIRRTNNFPANNILHEDFFNLVGDYDLIIEQTFFCAIDVKRRLEYARKAHSLLNVGGKLVGLLFNAPMYEDHPPYGGSVKEYNNYFFSLFELNIFEPAYNSILSRNGKELFINFQRK